MSLPRPSHVGTRPAYLDSLFMRDLPPTPTAHSSTSSISCSSTASSYDLRSAYFQPSRPLSPFVEEDRSDSFSTHSKKSFLGGRRKWRIGAILNRRTYPQHTDEHQYTRPSTSHHLVPPSPPPKKPLPPPPTSVPAQPIAEMSAQRRPSLPKLQTNFPPPQAISTYAKRPLPAVPGQQQQQQKPVPSYPPRVTSRPKLSRQGSSPRSSGGELSCQRCYYHAARNCQGYVLGGEPGDPCETCLVC